MATNKKAASSATKPKKKPQPKATKTRQRAKPDGIVEYLISDREGHFVIQVPVTWRVTFGWVNPSGHSGMDRPRDGHCVRVWEGEKLRAVFDGVTRLRDLSIPFARKVERETGNATWERDSKGNFKREEQRQLEESFEDEEVFVFGDE